jgi:hypothetical protein
MNDKGRCAAGLLLAMARLLGARASRPAGDAGVKTPAGEGHLVLIARTDRDDLVLDNLPPDIRRRAETRYAWLKRQSARDAMFWERM